MQKIIIILIVVAIVWFIVGIVKWWIDVGQYIVMCDAYKSIDTWNKRFCADNDIQVRWTNKFEPKQVSTSSGNFDVATLDDGSTEIDLSGISIIMNQDYIGNPLCLTFELAALYALKTKPDEMLALGMNDEFRKEAFKHICSKTLSGIEILVLAKYINQVVNACDVDKNVLKVGVNDDEIDGS